MRVNGCGSLSYYAELTLGTQVGLHALAVAASGVVDVFACLIGSDERDRLNTGLFAQELDSRNAAMQYGQNTLGETCETYSQRINNGKTSMLTQKTHRPSRTAQR